MGLNARYKDRQLSALAAPSPCHSHTQRLKRFLLHSDVFLLAGHTLGEILQNTSIKSKFVSNVEKEKGKPISKLTLIGSQ